MIKIIWWVLLIMWAFPELCYMFVKKAPSRIAHYLFDKVQNNENNI